MWKGRLAGIFKPTGWQIISYLGLASFILVMANFGVIESKLERRLGLSLSPQWHNLNTHLHNGLPHSAMADRLVLVAFWAGIGLVVYFITLGVLNLAIEAEDEVKISHEYINKGDQPVRARLPLAKLALAFGLVVALLISALWLYPVWLGLFLDFLSSLGSMISYFVLSAALVGVAVNLYLLHTVARLTFRPV